MFLENTKWAGKRVQYYQRWGDIVDDSFEYEFRMIGLKIAYYRKAHNPPYTQEQLAEIVGTSTSNIGTIESRMYKPISLKMLFKIAKALDVSPKDLLDF